MMHFETLKIIAIDFKDKFSQIHTLHYILYDTPLANKYFEVLRKNKAIADGNIEYSFNNKVEANYPEICKEIKHTVTTINKIQDHITLPEYDVLEQNELNTLHDLFEKWGDHPTWQEDRTTHNHFLKLNELIHLCENIITSDLNILSETFFGRLHDIRMGAIIDVRPTTQSGKAGIHFSVTDQDKLMLTSQYKWGGLYLGYNTLGKDYMHAMVDNDVRLIANDEVKPQKRYAAEIWINFGSDMIGPSTFQFATWVNKLDKEIKEKIPFNNLQDMMLGRLLLGEVCIADRTFANIDPDPDHWVTTDHLCKQKWNKEVFSTFREVVDIREEEDWPPYELLNFINNNHKKQWSPDIKPLPHFNLWKSDWPWAPMFVDLNEFRVHDELKRIDTYFVPHRDKDRSDSYGHQGWDSLTLHGISPEKTENYDQYGFKTEEEANYHWTDICEKCPYITDTIKSLPYSEFSRVRIMRLAPGGHIMPHNDGEGRIFGPYNLALTHPPKCFFVFEDKGLVPFKPGRGFFLDLGVKHCVVNYSNSFRYHIIIHGTLTSDVDPLIRSSLEKL